MKLLLLCALVAMALSQPMDSLDGQYQWELFKVEHMKEYMSEREEQHRKDIFLSNLQYVREHNERYKKGEVTFEVEINKFADMTTKEITDTRTGFKMPASYNSSGEQFILEDCLELPEAVDWRKDGAVTPVKDQLNCLSCWAFSATGTLEGQWFLKTKKLVPMSEQNLVDCSGEQYGTMGCSGSKDLHGAFDFIMDNKGINTEESYPYEGRDNECRYNPNTIAAQVTGYVHIKQGSEEELQKATATVGPISVAIDAGHISFGKYKQGIYKEPECSTDDINHAVLVVGYGTTSNGEDYWLVKNSWGTNWGMNGYMLFARNNNNMCGIANIPIYPKV